MRSPELLFIGALAVIGAAIAALGIYHGRSHSAGPAHRIAIGLVVSAAGHAFIVAAYLLLASAAYDGNCRPLLGESYPCDVIQYLFIAGSIIAAAALPAAPVYFLLYMLTSCLRQRVSRSAGRRANGVD